MTRRAAPGRASRGGTRRGRAADRAAASAATRPGPSSRAARSRRAELDAAGYAQREIATLLHVTQPAVCKMLRRMADTLIATQRDDLARQRVRLIARNDRLYREALRAYERSQQPRPAAGSGRPRRPTARPAPPSSTPRSGSATATRASSSKRAARSTAPSRSTDSTRPDDALTGAPDARFRQRPGIDSPASWIASLPARPRAALLRDLDEAALEQLQYLLPVLGARGTTPPAGGWRFWLFRGGRGAGKTRAGAEWVRSGVADGRNGASRWSRPTMNAGRQVMIEGASGILNVCPRGAARATNRVGMNSGGRTARSRPCTRRMRRSDSEDRSTMPPGATNSVPGVTRSRPGTCCCLACDSASIRAA